jgi:formate dehydrogenase major subunit
MWHSPVPTHPGLNMIDMLEAATKGKLKAMWAIGYDIVMTNPNTHETRRAMDQIDLVIVQDLFLNATAREFGDVFLPAASSFEKDGTFMNGERRVQRVRKTIEPIGSTKPDWEIVCLLATAMGHGDQFAFASPEEVWNEIRRVWPAGAGMSYGRLDAPGGLQWPCPTDDHPGTEVLHTNAFAALGPRAALRAIDHRPSPERPDADYPFTLITGRTLDQFNAGTMTRRSLTQELHPTDLLEISPDDAARYGIEDDDRVRIVSGYGTATLPARVNDRVGAGQLFTTFSDPGTALNRVTGPHRDRVTNTPEYKVTAVRLEHAPT